MPAWLAAIVQVPTPSSTRAPLDELTVQIVPVRELKVTGLPEAPPVALTALPVAPTTTPVGAAPKVIVWLAWPTEKPWVTCGAAR